MYLMPNMMAPYMAPPAGMLPPGNDSAALKYPPYGYPYARPYPTRRIVHHHHHHRYYQNATKKSKDPEDQEATNKAIEAAVQKAVSKSVAISVEQAIKRALTTTPCTLR